MGDEVRFLRVVVRVRNASMGTTKEERPVWRMSGVVELVECETVIAMLMSSSFTASTMRVLRRMPRSSMSPLRPLDSSTQLPRMCLRSSERYQKAERLASSVSGEVLLALTTYWRCLEGSREGTGAWGFEM